MKKVFALTAAGVLAATALATAANAAHTVQPAYFIHGTVDKVDSAKRTVTIAGHEMGGVTPYDITHLYPGLTVDATYVVGADGSMKILWVTDEEDRFVD